MIDFDRIYISYTNCMKHKGSSPSAMSFSDIDLCTNLQRIVNDINNRVYVHGPSSCFVVPNPCAREIYAAQFRDRIIQHFFCEEIEDCLNQVLIDRTASCRIDMGTGYALEVLKQDILEVTDHGTKDGYFWKIDLYGYFMSLIRDRMVHIMLDMIMDLYLGPYMEELLYLTPIIFGNNPAIGRILKCPVWVLEKVPERKRLDPNGTTGIAIGNITSQHGSNLYLNVIDHFITEILGFEHFIRYVDDMIVVSEDKQSLIEAVPLVAEQLEGIGLRLSPHKTYIDTVYHGVKFLGKVTYPYGYQVMSKENAGRLIASARNITIDSSLLSRLNSQIGRLRHYACYHLMHDYIEALPKDVWNYVYFDETAKKFVERKGE